MRSGGDHGILWRAVTWRGREERMSIRNRRQNFASARIAAAGLLLLLESPAAAAQERPPQRVDFPSADGKTMLVGYFFAPSKRHVPVPAVVLMHGRAGPYSSLAHGRFDASTLSK